jgi:hypothetical protein
LKPLSGVIDRSVSNCYWRQSQLSVVSLPRNHLNLLCQPGCRKTARLCLVGIPAQLEDTGELAPDLDPHLAVGAATAGFATASVATASVATASVATASVATAGAATASVAAAGAATAGAATASVAAAGAAATGAATAGVATPGATAAGFATAGVATASVAVIAGSTTAAGAARATVVAATGVAADVPAVCDARNEPSECPSAPGTACRASRGRQSRGRVCHSEPLADLFPTPACARWKRVPSTCRQFSGPLRTVGRPFLGGQAPTPGYYMSLSQERRSALREFIRTSLLIVAQGSIHLIARAWAACRFVT